MNDEKAYESALPNWRSEKDQGSADPARASGSTASARPAPGHAVRGEARSPTVYPHLVADRSREPSAAHLALVRGARVYPTFVLDPVRSHHSQRPFHPVQEHPNDAWPTIRVLVNTWLGLAKANESALVGALSTTLAEVERRQRERSLSLLAKVDLALARKVAEALGEVAPKGTDGSS